MGCIPACRLGVQPLRLNAPSFGTWRFPHLPVPTGRIAKMQTQYIAAHAVRPGMNISLAGSIYAVESNFLDRHCNGLYQARSVLVCNSLTDRSAYGQGDHFGLLPTAQVLVITAGVELA